MSGLGAFDTEYTNAKAVMSKAFRFAYCGSIEYSRAREPQTVQRIELSFQLSKKRWPHSTIPTMEPFRTPARRGSSCRAERARSPMPRLSEGALRVPRSTPPRKRSSPRARMHSQGPPRSKRRVTSRRPPRPRRPMAPGPQRSRVGPRSSAQKSSERAAGASTRSPKHRLQSRRPHTQKR